MTRRLTAGEAALREAARLEAARVYGRVCPQHKHPVSVVAAVSEAELSEKSAHHYDDNIIEAIRAGATNSQIIETFHVSYSRVRGHRMHYMRRGA